MAIPHPEPEIIKAIRAQRARIAAEEQIQMMVMADRWIQIEKSLEAQTMLLAREIADAGETATAAQLMRFKGYQDLLAQAEKEVTLYEAWANTTVSARQAELMRLGIDDAIDATGWAYQGSGMIVPSFSQLPTAAIEAIVGFAGDGSPLTKLLAETYPDAIRGLTQALIDGVARGLPPLQTAKAMRNGFGMGLNRALTIARTEQLRAYRFAAQEQYRTSGVVTGYMRIAQHNGNVCAGCLFAEGDIFPNDRDFDAHPNCRCSTIPIVEGVPPTSFVAGAEWFATQPENVQRSILGPGRYDAWQKGVPLNSMSTHIADDVWGGAFVPTPIGKLAQ